MSSKGKILSLLFSKVNEEIILFLYMIKTLTPGANIVKNPTKIYSAFLTSHLKFDKDVSIKPSETVGNSNKKYSPKKGKNTG